MHSAWHTEYAQCKTVPPEFTLAETGVGGQEAAGLGLVSFHARPSIVLQSAIPDPPTHSQLLPEILPALGALEVQACRLGAHKGVQVGQLQGSPHVFL